MKVTVLGCSESSGTPRIGCECEVCTSANPKNKRSRVSILVEEGDTRLLVDTSPDLRMQALREGIKTVDAVLYTHAHSDHVHGIDDVRSFNFHGGKVLPAFGDKETLAQLRNMFAYVFNTPEAERGWFRPQLEACEIEAGKAFNAAGVQVMPFRQQHGHNVSLGFRIGNFAYSTDVSDFPPESEEHLYGLDCWLVDCLSIKPVPTHAHLEKTLGWIEKFKPKRAVLTHMSHHLDYDWLNANTPPHVEAAYDGMVLQII